MASNRADQDALTAQFERVAAEYGAAISRVARGYEADEDRQRDLVQEIFVAVWRALPSFEGRSSLRTWAFRVAHNVALAHVARSVRARRFRSISLSELEEGHIPHEDARPTLEDRDALEKLAALVRLLRPLDRQIILLHLEGLEHREIAEVSGLSQGHVGVKVHRIKGALGAALRKQEEGR
jgi:RNA polymerase sigma-70 factor (ECF subfamily)